MARKFTGFVRNDRFQVGCTGGTVYVFDAEGRELAKFRDIRYGYTPLLCPGKDLLVVKSTAGMLAFFDLAELRLLKKLRVGFDGAQDDGFAFSPDGRYLYDLERPTGFGYNHISRYATDTLAREVLVEADRQIMYANILYSPRLKTLCILGTCSHRRHPVLPHGSFIACFDGEALTRAVRIPDAEANDLHWRIAMVKRDPIAGADDPARQDFRNLDLGDYFPE